MVKFVVKLKKCQIGTKLGVVVDIDPPIMIVVCGSSFWREKNLVNKTRGSKMQTKSKKCKNKQKKHGAA